MKRDYEKFMNAMNKEVSQSDIENIKNFVYSDTNASTTDLDKENINQEKSETAIENDVQK